MAAVLTAVLQNHLAWVSTVMPAGTAPSRAFLDKHSSKTVSLNVLLGSRNLLFEQGMFTLVVGELSYQTLMFQPQFLLVV